MARIGGKNSNFEKLSREKIALLNKSIQYRTNRITAILTAAYKNAKPTAKYWNTVRKNLDIQYRALDSIYSTWIKKNIPLVYRAAMKDLFTRLNRSKDIAKRAKRSFIDLATSPRTQQIQNILIRDAITDWVAALNQGQANLVRLTRRTQQALLSEALLDKSVAEAIASGNLMNNTFIKSVNMSETLAGQLTEVATVINGEKYVIAGSRRFTPKYYAEMVSRVKFHEAQSRAAMQTAGNYGTSLVQVSNHNTITPLCMEFEGKVFSMNGKDSRFPTLINTPPFHVNCLHLLFPMFESAMEVDGSLKGWEDFSNNRINRPPYPSSFIPVSERLAK